MSATEELSSYQRCVERISDRWQGFSAQRLERLREKERFGHAAERATESILEDLFTGVLDWSLGELNHQVGYADILLSRLGIKYLIVEAKAPGTLRWNQHAVDAALEQARRYADEQKVHNVAVSDGAMLYAAEVADGGLRDRCFVALTSAEPPEHLFWLSVQGIYRPRPDVVDAGIARLHEPEPPVNANDGRPDSQALVHPKYHLPAACFAYVGDANDPRTWHLPFLLADGQIDQKRLPKAIQAILTNYRGANLSTVPESDIRAVLIRLAQAAIAAGKMPDQRAKVAPTYLQLAEALDQLDCWESLRHDEPPENA